MWRGQAGLQCQVPRAAPSSWKPVPSSHCTQKGQELSCSTTFAAMRDDFALTFGNSTRKAYQKELERREQTLKML